MIEWKRYVGVAAVLIVTIANVVTIAVVTYLARSSIYCGLGVGVYGVLIYLPTALALLAVMFVEIDSKPVLWWRRMVFLGNAAFIVFLFVSGTCFSCVNECVVRLRGW